MSLVPNSATASSFSEAAKRSMNSVPIAVTSDGLGADDRRHELAGGERGAGGDGAGDGGRPAPTPRPADGAAIGIGDRRSVRRAVSSTARRPGSRAGLTGRQRGSQQSRNSPPPPIRRRRPCQSYIVAATSASDERPTGRDGARRRRRADGARGRRRATSSATACACTRSATATTALRGCDSNRPDLVVLDVMLPGADGLAVLRQLRADGDVPVILLTARTEEVDRVVGLELGADDYVVKPFSPRELAVRVRNMLRRAAGGAAAARRHDAATSAPCASTRRRGRSPSTAASSPLTPKEFDLLARAGPLAAPGVLPPPAARPGVGLGARVPGPGHRHRARRPAAPEAGGRPRAPALDRHGVGRRLPVRAVIARRRGSTRVRDRPVGVRASPWPGSLAAAVAAGLRAARAHPAHPLAAPPRARDHARRRWPSAPCAALRARPPDGARRRRGPLGARRARHHRRVRDRARPRRLGPARPRRPAPRGGRAPPRGRRPHRPHRCRPRRRARPRRPRPRRADRATRRARTGAGDVRGRAPRAC